MPNYTFRCRQKDCGTLLELIGLGEEEAREVICVECGSSELEVIEFDRTEEGVLQWIARELSSMRSRVKWLEDKIAGRAERKKARSRSKSSETSH